MHRPRNVLVVVSNLVVFRFFRFTRSRPRPSARHAHDDSPATLLLSIARRRPQRRAAPHAVSVVAFVAPPARSRCASGTCARHRNDVERQGRQATAPCPRATRRPSGFARTLASIKRRLPPPMSLVWHHAARCCSRLRRCTAGTSSPPPRSRRRSKRTTHWRRTARRHSAACAPPSRQLDQHQLVQPSMPHAPTQSVNREL